VGRKASHLTTSRRPHQLTAIIREEFNANENYAQNKYVELR